MRLRLSLLAVCVFTVGLIAQSAITTIERLDQAIALLAPLDTTLTGTDLTNFRQANTRLKTLRGKLAGDQQPPPPPTTAVLDSLTLAPSTVAGGTPVVATVTLTAAVSADTSVALTSGNLTRATVPASVVIPAGALSATAPVTTLPQTANVGVQITATLAGVSKVAALSLTSGAAPPPTTEICGNGIDDDGDGQIDEGCQPAPPTTGSGCGTSNPSGFAYFESLRQHADCLSAYSLRDPKQLETKANGGYAYCNACPLDVTYDSGTDAAKVVVGTSSNSLRNQIRLPIPSYGSSLFVTWDVFWGDEFRQAVSGIPTYKAFQFASPADRIWTEVRSRFSQAPADQIARVDVRYYGVSFGPGSGWDWTMSGKWAGSADAIGPQTGEFVIAPQTWTRYFAHFEQDPSGFWAFSLWMADANRAPVNLLNRRLIKPNGSSRWESFWLEFNTSTNTVKAGRPPLVVYVRNVAALKGVTASSVSALLVKP